MDVNLRELQVKLEQYMADEAITRMRNDAQSRDKLGEWSDSRQGRTFVQAVMDYTSTSEHLSFIDAIANAMSVGEEKKVGRGIKGVKLIRSTKLKPNELAYLTTKTVFNMLGLGKGRLLRSTLCMRIARVVEHEVAIRRFTNTQERKRLIKKLMKDFDAKTYPKEWRKRTIKHYFDVEGIEWQEWDNKDCIHIGYVLFKLFMDTTGLVSCYDDTHVEISNEMLDRMEQIIMRNAGLFTLYRPMVVPPIPWSEYNLFKGGYLTSKVKRYALVKGSGKRDVERLVNADLSKVLPAINAIQETPWRVNKAMLEAEEWAFHEHGGGIGSMITADEEPMPPKPWNYDTDEKVRKEHNRVCFEVHSRRRQDKTRRISAMITLSMANENKDYEAIFYPHSLDSRGRAYPVPAFLTPQGPDYAKALLEFAEGKPVDTQSALNWLSITGANAYGNDKVSLADRIKWVHDNEEMILSCASDYRTDHRWMRTSEPFQFLRFCFEWKKYKDEGLGFLSHMVCPVDATNSGMQHLSAMMRDEVGGRSVNLVPGLPRQDIYADVANVVIRKLKEMNTVEAADWVAFGIDRKITKRQVMVKPYNGKMNSCIEYTRDAVKEKLADGHPCPFDMSEFYSRTLMLGQVIWSAIHEVIIKGGEVMEWLSTIASEYSKAANKTGVILYQRRMEWTVPDGFPVVHFREDDNGLHRIDTTFEGRCQLSFTKYTGKLSPKDMALALPPNFVHALDACHLRMTIVRGLDKGITSFGMVHDSFGTHAAEMDRFVSKCVKPAFIELYGHDVINDFAERYKEFAPPQPSRGYLNLAGVQDSEFFFS